jgi:hypothetical protein
VPEEISAPRAQGGRAVTGPAVVAVSLGRARAGETIGGMGRWAAHKVAVGEHPRDSLGFVVGSEHRLEFGVNGFSGWRQRCPH